MSGLGQGRGVNDLNLFARLRNAIYHLDWQDNLLVAELQIEDIVDHYQNSAYKCITELTKQNGDKVYLLAGEEFNPGFGALVGPDMRVKAQVNVALHKGDPASGPMGHPLLVNWPYKGSTLNISTKPWAVSGKISLNTWPSKGICYYVPHPDGEIIGCVVTDIDDLV